MNASPPREVAPDLALSLQSVAAEAMRRQAATRPSPHRRTLPLRVGTRASPLALVQTRAFLTRLTRFCPVLRDMGAFQEHQMTTTGDQVQSRRLAEIGGKGLFAKEIHEALAEGRIDFAVHSLKDLETTLPDGLELACTLRREDERDVLILHPRLRAEAARHADPLDVLPEGAVIGCSSVRRQAQLLHRRPDLRFTLLRGNVQTRLDKLAGGACDATMLALAGLRRLGMEDRADIVLDPEKMVPAAGQGIVGVTVRSSDTELLDLLSAIEDPEARVVATAERALLAVLDGSCRTPIGGYARLVENGRAGHETGHGPLAGRDLVLTGLVAREDGSFYLKREIRGAPADARRLGEELGASLRADSPADIFEDSAAG
ncbi:hydroxymethylbilane synthase [Acidomonas methanolica]|uniref:Porphobilinogen deaminase n=1 Tax=Acidomonas methanolica NBRC 104435 TaxID=1231351 RepID=A0A023D851_ACIMT|nr:hydroxymethylbilane synthase [Acidomonas methanolica]MBU2654625.1 hydroxymethylbilane synthase [Acidomonas methanolica]MCQ9155531.1 hydroxymethylbilane synthase [Acidomonas methanolica]TCS27498.1 hydroxymethylbilane synthase [Acidomonas methanolica]GAJ30298.1 porphobilinogen deaminase [Acidomonas methanolica NBRC 104435]GBQ58431.1 porphobilinogen deaminase [Acidomonas methanolica]